MTRSAPGLVGDFGQVDASPDMPGMSMVFKVSDPKLLDALKPGDKVRFAANGVNGNITVTAIEPVR